MFWKSNREGVDTSQINLYYTQAMGLVCKVWAWNELPLTHTKCVRSGKIMQDSAPLIFISDPLPGPRALWYPKKTNWIFRDTQWLSFPTPMGFLAIFCRFPSELVSSAVLDSKCDVKRCQDGFPTVVWCEGTSCKILGDQFLKFFFRFMLYLCPWGKHQKGFLPQSSYWFSWSLQEYSIYAVSLSPPVKPRWSWPHSSVSTDSDTDGCRDVMVS